MQVSKDFWRKRFYPLSFCAFFVDWGLFGERKSVRFTLHFSVFQHCRYFFACSGNTVKRAFLWRALILSQNGLFSVGSRRKTLTLRLTAPADLVNLTDGHLALSSNGSTFHGFTPLSNPFPAEGDFAVNSLLVLLATGVAAYGYAMTRQLKMLINGRKVF